MASNVGHVESREKERRLGGKRVESGKEEQFASPLGVGQTMKTASDLELVVKKITRREEKWRRTSLTANEKVSVVSKTGS